MFEIGPSGFLMNGEPFVIRSAALHYFRFLPEQWEDRLRKLKACGFNTVETYVCWNLHEKTRGCFDFDGGLDVGRFLDLAKSLGLWAIVRPSPYICAEADGGGLPAWLLTEPGDTLPRKLRKITLRSSDPVFLGEVARYYRVLIPLLAERSVSRGGNILLCQLENEYGSYGNDRDYLAALAAMIRENGLDVPLFTADSSWLSSLSAGNLRVEDAPPVLAADVPPVLAAVNFGSRPDEHFARLEAYQPAGPRFCAEYWDGWFDRWGGTHAAQEPERIAADLRRFLERGDSFNFYMFAGGTNFGLLAGANDNPLPDGFQPTVTSYDYAALVDEGGRCTPAFFAVKALLAPEGETEDTASSAADDSPAAAQCPGTVLLDRSADVAAFLQTAPSYRSAVPLCYEELGLPGGLMLCRTKLRGPREAARLFADGLHDEAKVYLDGALLGTLRRNECADPAFEGLPLPEIPAGTAAVLELVTESFGHVNYSPGLLDRKGLTGPVRSFGQRLFGWECIPLAPETLAALPCGEKVNSGRPTDEPGGQASPALAGRGPFVLAGRFAAEPGRDCFIHPDGLTDGYLFVNGFFLGRYRAEGPQRALYLPGPLLREENELRAVELTAVREPRVRITDEPALG